MPATISATTGGDVYHSPMIGPVHHTQQIRLDVSTLTTAEVDSNGYLKPGVVVNSAGDPVAAGQAVYGVVFEATKLAHATIPPTDVSLAADTADHDICVATHGVVSRDIAEDNLGRAYTADEIAGFALANSHLRLTPT